MTTNIPPVRHAWMDAVKGLCIILVVLWHSSIWMDANYLNGEDGIWTDIGTALKPLRMPVFFFISGILAVTALTRPWRKSLGRTTGLYYLYAVWTIIVFAQLWSLAKVRGDEIPPVLDLAVILIAPGFFWYLYALALYFIISKLAMRYLGSRSPLLLIPFAMLSIFAIPLTAGIDQAINEPVLLKVGSTVQNIVWFYAGTQLKEYALDSALPEVSKRLPVVTLAFGVGTMLAVASHTMTIWLFPLSILAIYIVLGYARVLNFNNTIGRGLQYLGTRTLTVYLMHNLCIAIISFAIQIAHVDRYIGDGILFQAVVPLAVACVALTTPLVIRAVLPKIGLGAFIEPPRWIVGGRPRRHVAATAR